MQTRRAVLVVAISWIAASTFAQQQSAIRANGIIESSSGGFKFPDGTVQTTATAVGPQGPQGPQGPAGGSGPTAVGFTTSNFGTVAGTITGPGSFLIPLAINASETFFLPGYWTIGASGWDIGYSAVNTTLFYTSSDCTGQAYLAAGGIIKTGTYRVSGLRYDTGWRLYVSALAPAIGAPTATNSRRLHPGVGCQPFPAADTVVVPVEATYEVPGFSGIVNLTP